MENTELRKIWLHNVTPCWHAYTMMGWCWASVRDAGPTLTQLYIGRWSASSLWIAHLSRAAPGGSATGRLSCSLNAPGIIDANDPAIPDPYWSGPRHCVYTRTPSLPDPHMSSPQGTLDRCWDNVRAVCPTPSQSRGKVSSPSTFGDFLLYSIEPLTFAARGRLC